MPLLTTRRERALLLILALGVAILIALSPFVSGLLGAAVLYVLCVGPFKTMERVMPASLASLLTLVGAVIVIALPLVWLVSLVIAQAPDVLRGAQDSPFLDRISNLRIGKYDVGAEIARASGTVVSWLSAQAINFVGGAASASINLVIAFFGLYYMLHSSPQLWVGFRDYVPFSPATAEALRVHFYSVTRATLLGTALTAAAQGTLVGASFWLVGLPSAAFWGTVTAFVSVLPILGSGLVWIPGVVALAVQQRYGAALVVFVVGGVAASNVDNLIRPWVYRRVSNIHPMITLVGAFAGVRYFGIPGLLLGPLGIAYFFELLRFFRQEYGAPDEKNGESSGGAAPDGTAPDAAAPAPVPS